MVKEEIDNPNSQEAIDLCLSCELWRCEMEMSKEELPNGIVNIRRQQARQLYYEGKMAAKDIAKLLGMDRRTVYRHIK